MLYALKLAQKKYYKILLQKPHKSAEVPLQKLTYFKRNLTLQGKIPLLIWIYTFHMDDIVCQFSVIMGANRYAECIQHSELKQISLSLGSCAPATFEGSH